MHSFKQYSLQISKNYDLMISIVNNNNFVGKEESQDHNDWHYVSSYELYIFTGSSRLEWHS